MEAEKDIEEEITKDEKKSNKKIFIVLVIISLILGIIFIFNNRKSGSDSLVSENKIENRYNQEADSKYQTKTDDQANVTIDVTPDLGLERQENIFELSFNTHSVDLNFDFQKIIILRDDLGNIYQAQNWTGGQGGHHLSGEIIFPALNEDAKTIEMEINGVGGVKRVFKWDI